MTQQTTLIGTSFVRLLHASPISAAICYCDFGALSLGRYSPPRRLTFHLSPKTVMG